MRSFLRNSIFHMYISQNVGKMGEGTQTLLYLKYVNPISFRYFYSEWCNTAIVFPNKSL